MRFLKMFMASVTLVILFVTLVTVIAHFAYVKGHRESEKRRLALCERFAIAERASETYLQGGSYPVSIQEVVPADYTGNEIVCVGPFTVKEGEVLDPWGNPYMYQRLSPSRIKIAVQTSSTIIEPLRYESGHPVKVFRTSPADRGKHN